MGSQPLLLPHIPPPTKGTGASPVSPCPAASCLSLWKCLVSAPQERASWADKSIFQGGATALSGMRCYPLQSNKTYNEMIVATSFPCLLHLLPMQELPGMWWGSVNALASSCQGLNKSCSE